MASINPIGIPFIELSTVDSTNNYAMGLAHEGMAQHGTAVFAHEQTKGKGQRGKSWLSAKDQNIALSILIRPRELDRAHTFLLSMAIANAVSRFCLHYLGEEIKIKWPNDIYWRDRKAAGILIENLWQGTNWKFAVIGIGININQTIFGDLQLKAVSFRQITGKTFDPALLAKELCPVLQEEFLLLLQHPQEITRKYKSLLYRLNESVRFQKGPRVFEAIIRDVTPKGELVVEHGVEESFEVGEVEWIG